MAWGALAAFALTMANLNLGHFLRIPAQGTLAGHVVSLLYLLPVLLALMTLARGAAFLKLSTPFLLLAGVALTAPMGTVFLLQRAGSGGIPPWLAMTANNLFGPIGMVLIGSAIGRLLKHSNTLLVAAGFGLFFDIVVVTLGPVAQLLKGGQAPLIAAVSVGAGAPHPVGVAGRSIPLLSGVTIGPADVLFIAIFLGSVWLLESKPVGTERGGAQPGSEKRTFWWIFGLLALALVLVEVTALPVPALAPMGVAVLIANWRNRAFTPREKRDLAIAAPFALACAALIVFLATRLVPPATPAWGLSVAPVTKNGRHLVLIDGVVNDSPAAKAGIKPGELVLGIERQSTSRMTDDELVQKLTDTATTNLELMIASPRERPRRVTLERPK
jgi:hypothetical protein